MKRFVTVFIPILVIVLAISALFWYFFKDTENAWDYNVTAANGQTYNVYVSNSDDCYMNGVSLTTGSRQSIQSLTSQNDSYIGDISPVHDEQGAVKQGIHILNSVYDSWTYDNGVMVTHNRTADLWIVHGQMESRETSELYGIVAFDAATGEILILQKTAFDAN